MSTARGAGRAEAGRRAEQAVADYLVTLGFAIVGRNVRLGALELDVVAQKGDLAVVVEVRTRGPGSLQGPFESLTPTKRRRLRQAEARLWRERRERLPGVARIRLDAAAVWFEGERTRVEYVEAAFDGAA